MPVFNRFIGNILQSSFKSMCVLSGLFIALRLPVLFAFPGVLGSDESYEILVLIKDLFSGNFQGVSFYLSAYHYLAAIIQALFTYPFYCLWPDNEFSVFFGCFLVSFFTLFSNNFKNFIYFWLLYTI